MKIKDIFRLDNISSETFKESDKGQMREFEALTSAFVKLDVAFSTTYNPGTGEYQFEFPALRK